MNRLVKWVSYLIIAIVFSIALSGCVATNQTSVDNILQKSKEEANSNNSTSPEVETEPVDSALIAPKADTGTQPSSPNYSSSNIVKKSSTGICHAPGTTYYDRTTNYISYITLSDCLSSGGRLPKK